ncbi:hypothetical protein CBM2629_A20014 [Cupriavidus taiwanensis]|nr:hypothetical protein CBM2629_A20014 [Cupriavidus taiwanensis]
MRYTFPMIVAKDEPPPSDDIAKFIRLADPFSVRFWIVD